MKAAVRKIIFLSILGLAGLIGCLYFQFPLYGYVIWGVLLAIFAYTQLKNLKNLAFAQAEIDAIHEQKSTGNSTIEPSDRIIYQRYEILKDLQSRDQHVDLSAFSEILSARASSKLGSSAANLTMTLGLLGTFFGLMGAISTAGSSMSESFEIQTLITTIFSDMNGIFGTSLTGLIAFMLLSVANSVVKNAYIEMMSEVEEYTHFYLIPQLAPEQENRNEQLITELSSNLSQFVDSLGSKLTEHSNDMSTQLTNNSASLSNQISDKLESTFTTLQQSITDANSLVIEQLSGSHKSVLDDIISKHSQSASEAIETQRELLASFSSQVENSAHSILESQKEISSNTSNEIAERLSELNSFIKTIPDMQKEIAELSTQGVSTQLDNLHTVIQSIPEAQGQQIEKQMELLNTHQEQSRGLQTEYMSHNQGQMDTVFQKTTEFTESLKESISMISRDGFSKLQDEFETLAQAAKVNFEIQEKLGKELETQYSEQMSSLMNFTENISEGGNLMKINQVEFQASLEMFTIGVESLIEHISSSESETDDQNSFYEKLESTLEAFHEKASEVLVENALKTQEILIEVLEQVKLQGESLEEYDQEPEV
ncbi:MAG: hypothetical protein OCC49_06850 [Fibrobacterales bacterium]